MLGKKSFCQLCSRAIAILLLEYSLTSFLDSANAAGSVSHGTYFAYSYKEDEFVVAIDSRRTEIQPSGVKIFDDKCKIRGLGKRVFFFAQGLAGNSYSGVPAFDVFDVATEVFQQSDGAEPIPLVAARWGAVLLPKLKQLHNVYPTAFPNKLQVTSGYFVGFDADNTFVGVRSTISLSEDGEFKTLSFPISMAREAISGHAREWQELTEGKTARSEVAQLAMRKVLEVSPAADHPSVRLQELVAVLPMWANDAGSGGEIASASMDLRAREWRWVKRPAHCW